MPDISVVVSTYNSPRSLNLVLRGYRCQRADNFEIVVADDGSGAQTTELVRHYKREAGPPVLHVWQEDAGFQKCRILNKAIAAARGEYLVFVDGDCIPRNDFVSTHRELRAPGLFLSGAMYRLNDTVTAKVSEQDVVSQDVFRPGWLMQHGQPNHLHKLVKLTRNRLVSRLAEAVSRAYPGWNGANSSCYRADALKVNGFNERMTYGAEDMEFGLRLSNAGLRPRKIRYAAACVHLEHGRGYETEAGWAHNRAILDESSRQGLVRLPEGVDAYLNHTADFLVD